MIHPGHKILHGGKVLVMDDEEMVRDVAVSMLETMGYEGHAVKDGSEAVDAYLGAMKAGIPFDAVILDLEDAVAPPEKPKARANAAEWKRRYQAALNNNPEVAITSGTHEAITDGPSTDEAWR